MPCIGNVPTIVASGSISQPSGGTFSTTTLFTPSAAGVFRISVYFDGSISHGSGASVSWTDNSGSASVTFQLDNDPWALSGGNKSSWSDVIAHATANAIQASIAYNILTSAYTFYYVVEQLA